MHFRARNLSGSDIRSLPLEAVAAPLATDFMADYLMPISIYMSSVCPCGATVAAAAAVGLRNDGNASRRRRAVMLKNCHYARAFFLSLFLSEERARTDANCHSAERDRTKLGQILTNSCVTQSYLRGAPH